MWILTLELGAIWWRASIKINEPRLVFQCFGQRHMLYFCCSKQERKWDGNSNVHNTRGNKCCYFWFVAPDISIIMAKCKDAIIVAHHTPTPFFPTSLCRTVKFIALKIISGQRQIQFFFSLSSPSNIRSTLNSHMANISFCY